MKTNKLHRIIAAMLTSFLCVALWAHAANANVQIINVKKDKKTKTEKVFLSASDWNCNNSIVDVPTKLQAVIPTFNSITWHSIKSTNTFFNNDFEKKGIPFLFYNTIFPHYISPQAP
ncbi:MAG: hypothetical protein RLZZ175_1318 [Bacteroidota bacterium]|jgi:hypothetical protein